MRKTGITLILVSLLALALVPATGAQSKPASPDIFDPQPQSQPVYEIDPVPRKHYVRSGDERVYVETHLPTPLPETGVPTILSMSPWESNYRTTAPHFQEAVNYFVPRGYAVALAHVPGTGNSTGCLDFHGPVEVAATSDVIQYLGRDAAWSTGKVGMRGGSYDGATQIFAAALGDRRKTSYLKAIVPQFPTVSRYDSYAMDGVPNPPGVAMVNAVTASGLGMGGDPSAAALAQTGRQECTPANVVAAVDLERSGDFAPYWAARSAFRGASRVRAATLMQFGLADREGAGALGLMGFFDALPDSTPHSLVLGQWGHEQPHSAGPDIRRLDWLEMEQAWYDRYLLGLRTGVEDWPTVQVQDSVGRWRTEPGWPAIDGRPGQLALGAGGSGADGSLGAESPTGTSTYQESSVGSHPNQVTFTTPALTAPVHLAGVPVVDLWVSLDKPDAHLAATLEILDGPAMTADVWGARSARHLNPLPDLFFEQAQGTDPAVGRPIRVPIRLSAIDQVVPKGARIRLTIAGTALPVFPTAPSGADTVVTVHHNCLFTSALRFLSPSEDPHYLIVPGASEPGPEEASSGTQVQQQGPVVPGAEEVCGRRPIDPARVLAGKA